MRQNSQLGFLAGICFLALLNGCAAIGLTLFGVGAGVGTGTAVAYTLDGTAYRTFTAPLLKVEDATLLALDREDEGRAALLRLIEAPLDPEWSPEDREFKVKARTLLSRISEKDEGPRTRN